MGAQQVTRARPSAAHCSLSPAEGTRTMADELLPPPEEMLREIPLGSRAAAVQQFRAEARMILAGTDDRLLVVAGPCAVHDPVALLDYAHRLAALSSELQDDVLIVLRMYCEKPRTILGWRGLINDPRLDGS